MARTVTFDVLAVAHGVGFDELGSKIKGVARDSQVHISSLVAGLTAIGPAMLPIGAAAVALGASLTGLGAAGLLAFVGIRNEMKQGTILGLAYQKALKPIVDEFHALSYLAAVQVFTGINSAVQSSRKLFPLLAQDISLLAHQLGEIISHLVPGLIALFVRLNPLFVGIGNQLVRLSAGFQRWATSGTGVTKFVEYAQANLPRVEKILGQLVVAIGRLSQGLFPLGGISLSTIGVFARLVNAIPVPVLQKIAPIIAGIVIATKAWEVAAKALNIVLEANPFIRIATLVLAVGTALVIAYQRSETFRNVVKGVFKDIELTFLYAARYVIQYFLIPVLDVFSAIVHGAAVAFGWVPGVGPKLRTAAKAFDDFHQRAVNALSGLKVQIDTLEAGRAVARMRQAIDQLHSKQITISTYVQQIILPTLGTPSFTHDSRGPGAGLTAPYARAGGGPVMAGQSYIVGEQRPEVFTPSTSGYITPYVPRGGNTYIVNVLNGDPRATVRALEQFVGGGGKIHISRGIA